MLDHYINLLVRSELRKIIQNGIIFLTKFSREKIINAVRNSHMQSYRLFADKTNIVRAVKRCARVGQPSPEWCIDVPTSMKSTCNVECSSSSKTRDQPKARHVTSQRQDT